MQNGGPCSERATLYRSGGLHAGGMAALRVGHAGSLNDDWQAELALACEPKNVVAAHLEACAEDRPMRLDARLMSISEIYTWCAYRGRVDPMRKIVNMVWADDSSNQWSPYQNDNMHPFQARRIVIDTLTRVIIVDPEEDDEEQDQWREAAFSSFRSKVTEWLQYPAEVSDHRLDIDSEDAAPNTADVAAYHVGAIHELPLRRRV